VRVPDSKARQYCLARRYSGHDALPADCKVPWQLIVAVLRIGTSDPPPLAWHTPQSHSTAIRVVAEAIGKTKSCVEERRQSFQEARGQKDGKSSGQKARDRQKAWT